MTSQDSTQAGGWVDRAITLSRAASAAQIRYQLDSSLSAAMRVTQTAADFRQFLTTHASQQAAVVAGLVGALEGVFAYLTGADPRNANTDKEAAQKISVALAAYHAMKEKP